MLLGLFVVLYIIPLGAMPVALPDEARYAEIPREMIASGDWIVPRLNGLRYFEKPPFGYWATAASMSVIGDNRFAFRLPSAVATGLSALLIFLLVTRFGGGHKPALLAAAAFLTSAEVAIVGTFNVLDPLFSMFVTASLVFFFLAYSADSRRKRLGWQIAFGICVGLGFLTKGFLAFVLPAIIIGPFLIWERRWKDLFTMPWIPVIVALLVIMPWAIAIHLREKDYWYYFVVVEHLRRFFAPMGKAQHKEPFYFFVQFIIGGGLPWMALAPAAAIGLRREKDNRSLVRFCICWAGMIFLFMSASSGKLGTYILPSFPAIAVLISLGLLRYLESGHSRAFATGSIAFAMLLLVVAALVAIAHSTGWPSARLRVFSPTETMLLYTGLAALIAWAAALAAAACPLPPDNRLILFFAGPLLTFICIRFIIPVSLCDRMVPEDFYAKNAAVIRKSDALLSTPSTVHAACWFYKRSDLYLFRTTGECAYGLGHKDSAHRFVPMEELPTFLKERRGKRVVILTDADSYRYMLDTGLPQPVFKDSCPGFVLLQY